MAGESTARALDVNIHSALSNHKCPPVYKCNTLGTYHKKIITYGVPGKWLIYTKEGKRSLVHMVERLHMSINFLDKENMKNAK
eukprot:753271-Ditylum_brightwellii.AAC.1